MNLQNAFAQLTLRNQQPDPDARIAIVSLPQPLGAPLPAQLGDLPTQVQPIAHWPASVAGRADAPRRQLVVAVADGPLPGDVRVHDGAPAAGDFTGPTVACRIVSKKSTGVLLREVNELELAYGEARVGLRLGLSHAGTPHWWEWVTVEQLWTGPLCQAIRVGGFIEVGQMQEEELMAHGGVIESITAGLYHKHNWLRGELYALLFANGVVQLTCRHVNNRLFDQGRDLEDALPIIGFRADGITPQDVALDGRTTEFAIGPARLDLREAGLLVSPEHPGRLTSADGLAIYQPYEGVEIVGDLNHQARNDGYIVRGVDRRIPRGVARNVRFCLSLGTAAPRVSRLTVPAWWYALARDLWADDCLPVRDDRDLAIESAENDARERLAKRVGCFDSSTVNAAIWDGEVPYAQLLYAYRTGDPVIHQLAIDESYFFADIAFDHASETIRMQDYPFGAVAPPLYRTVPLTFGWLETGDPWLRDLAESGATHYYWIDRHNWPRRTYGRDAGSLRSLIFLWDYTGREDYLAMAREALGRAVSCQRPDGSTGDQGGAVGIQGGNAHEITKPWMALIAADPVMDYLQRRPGDAELLRSLLATGGFILRSQLEKDGRYFWSYQYRYGDNPGDPWEMRKNPETFTRYPSPKSCANGYKARFLTLLTALTGDLRYLEAWQRFYATHWGVPGQEPKSVGYAINKVLQNLPFEQAFTWNARLNGDGLRLRPVLTAVRAQLAGTILTPWGDLEVTCARDGDQVRIETRCAADFPIQVELPAGTQTMRSTGTMVV
ncbi:hypothetical protein HQ590_10240 [bacterium]|nr:hypothetical protein [bacterium]